MLPGLCVFKTLVIKNSDEYNSGHFTFRTQSLSEIKTFQDFSFLMPPIVLQVIWQSKGKEFCKYHQCRQGEALKMKTYLICV